MNNVIDAVERFSDKALMDSIEFKLWQYDRYWLGLDVQTCRNFADVAAMHSGEQPYLDAQVNQLERLYTKWLTQHGDDVAGRC